MSSILINNIKLFIGDESSSLVVTAGVINSNRDRDEPHTFRLDTALPSSTGAIPTIDD